MCTCVWVIRLITIIDKGVRSVSGETSLTPPLPLRLSRSAAIDRQSSPLGAASKNAVIIKTVGAEAVMNQCQLMNSLHPTVFHCSPKQIQAVSDVSIRYDNKDK